MKIENLKKLSSSMRSEGLSRYKFEYKVGKAVFDIFFFIDTDPWELLFGAKGKNFSFTKEVNRGFIIDPSFDRETYKRLCEVLGLAYNPSRKFSPVKFFEEFNRNIPAKANPQNNPKPHNIAIYRKNVEESEKIYFCGWRDNASAGKKVTESNLEKTLKILGKEAYEICKNRNISSCWTDDALRATKFVLP
jgi:hypothetical protein